MKRVSLTRRWLEGVPDEEGCYLVRVAETADNICLPMMIHTEAHPALHLHIDATLVE